MTRERNRAAPPLWAQQLAQLSDAAYVVLPGAHNTCSTFPRSMDATLRQTISEWAATGGSPTRAVNVLTTGHSDRTCTRSIHWDQAGSILVIG